MNLGCKHARYLNTLHCAEMACENYVSKCPLHAIVRTGEICNRPTFNWAIFKYTAKGWELYGITQFDEYITEAEEKFEAEGVPYRTVALEPPSLQEVEAVNGKSHAN